MNYKEEENKLRSLLKSLDPLKARYPSLADCIDNIEEELDNEEFRITVVGEFSSGKSTFLNALMGKSILPSANQETTATVTYIHNVPANDPRCGMAIVSLHDGIDLSFDINDKKQMIEYTSRLNSNSKLKVAQDVECVNLYVNFGYTDEKIVLIDTPGLNGVATGHADITTKEIAQSQASICLFGFKGLSATDLEFLQNLMKVQSTFFFVQNCIDLYKIDEGEYPEQKIEEFKKMVREKVYQDRQEPKFVFGISALKAIVARDTSIDKLYQNDDKLITAERRKEILAESYIPDVEKVIFGFVNSQERIQSFFGSLLTQLYTVISDILESAIHKKEIREVSITENPDIAYLEKLRKEAKERTTQYRTQIPVRVSNKFEDAETSIKRTVADDLHSECDRIISIISALHSIEEIVKFQKEKRIEFEIRKFDNCERIRIPKLIDEKANVVLSEIFSEIKRRLPQLSVSNDKELKGKGLSVEFSIEADFTISSKIDKLRQELAVKERDKTNAENRLNVVQSIERERDRKNRELDNKRREISALGYRPPIQYRTVQRTEKVRKGFFGRIWGCITGSGSYKEVTYTETVEDDSARREWDRKKAQYEYQISVCAKECRDLENKLNGESSYSVRMEIERKRQVVERKKREIELEQEREKRMIEVSKTNAMARFKKQMCEAVTSFFSTVIPYGEIYVNYLDWCGRIIKATSLQMEKELLKYYDGKVADFFKELDSMISTKKTDEENSEIRKSITILEEDIKKLSDALDKIQSSPLIKCN